MSLLIAESRSIVEVARQAGHSATMALDTYGHVFDELEGVVRMSAEQAIRKASADARATLVRPVRVRRQLRLEREHAGAGEVYAVQIGCNAA